MITYCKAWSVSWCPTRGTDNNISTMPLNGYIKMHCNYSIFLPPDTLGMWLSHQTAYQPIAPELIKWMGENAPVLKMLVKMLVTII